MSDIGVGYLIGILIGGVFGFVVGRMIVPWKTLTRGERTVQGVLISGLLLVLIGSFVIFIFLS